MKKYRLEIFLASVFAALLVAMLWTRLSIPSVPYLPWILLGLCLVPPLAVVSSSFGKKGEETERYAPKFFGQLFLSSVVGIVLCVAFAVVLNRDNFSKTIDLTQRKVHSLSDESLKVVRGLDKKIQIVCVPELQRASRYCEENQHLMGLFAQANPEKIAVGAVRMNDIATLRQLAPTGDRRLVLQMEGNRSELAGQVTESKLTNAIINLTKGKKTVYFLTGNGEPGIGWESDRNYATLVDFLKKRGYDAKEHKISAGPLPADAQVLVAGSTVAPYPQYVEEMLRRFLAKGGQLILSVNPYRPLGLEKLLSDVGVSLDNNVLVGDGGKTPLGTQLSQANPMRPPVALGEFSRVSDISSKLSLPYGVADGARSITVAEKNEGDFKVRHTELASAFAASAVTVSEADRTRLSLDGPFNAPTEAAFDPKKTYKVAYEIAIEGADRLAAGLPPVAEPAAAPTPAATPAPAADAEKGKAKIVLVGFELQAKYVQPEVSTQVEMPLLAVSYLYQDKDLVTVPTKDYSPKQFRMDRNPASWLPIFAFFLPAGTVLMGLYIWLRRRSS